MKLPTCMKEKGQWRWCEDTNVNPLHNFMSFHFITTAPPIPSPRSMFLSVILYFVEVVPFKEGDKSQHCDVQGPEGGNQDHW